MVVLGMKELYGGGLFVRESNNTLIFVRSSYRVFRIQGWGLIISWARLDGLRDLHLPKLGDFLMRDCMIRWFPHFNVVTENQAAMQWVQKYAPLFGGDPQKYQILCITG
jgi:hypothetical protein